MAVCEGRWSQVHRLHRKQIRQLRRIHKAMVKLNRLDLVGVETAYDGIYVPGIGAVSYEPGPVGYRLYTWSSCIRR